MNTIKPIELLSNIDQQTVKSLFKTKPLIHGFNILLNWAIIIGIIILHQYWSSIFLYPIAVIIIGARIHALAILMHDATHFRFIKNRKWNDIITNFSIMYPIFTSIEEYRVNHLNHHKHLNTDDDPDWVAKLTKREFQFPKSKAEFLLTVGSYLILYQGVLDAIWFLKRYKVPAEKNAKKSNTRVDKVGFYVILILTLTILGLWKIYLLYWIIPYLTSFFMFQYIRSAAEHFGEMGHDHELNSSRTVIPTFIEKMLIAPHNVSYHLEHHLFPGVPFYHLPTLHASLMEQPVFRENAHITKGYLSGLLKELTKQENKTLRMTRVA